MNAPRMVACSSRDTAQPRRLLRRPPRRRVLPSSGWNGIRAAHCGLERGYVRPRLWVRAGLSVNGESPASALFARLSRFLAVATSPTFSVACPPTSRPVPPVSDSIHTQPPTVRRLSALLVFRARSVDFPFFDTSDAIGLPTGVSAPFRRHGHYRLLSVALGLQKARPPQDLT